MLGRFITWSCGQFGYGGGTSAPPMAHAGSTFPQYRSHAHVTRGRMATRPVTRATANRFRIARRYHAAASRWFETEALATSAAGGASRSSIATNARPAPAPADGPSDSDSPGIPP